MLLVNARSTVEVVVARRNAVEPEVTEPEVTEPVVEPVVEPDVTEPDVTEAGVTGEESGEEDVTRVLGPGALGEIGSSAPGEPEGGHGGAAAVSTEKPAVDQMGGEGAEQATSSSGGR